MTPRYAAAYTFLAESLANRDRLGEADQAITEALSLLKNHKNMHLYADALSVYGLVLQFQENDDEAEKNLKLGYEGLKKNSDRLPGFARHRLPRAATRLARFYESRGERSDDSTSQHSAEGTDREES